MLCLNVGDDFLTGRSQSSIMFREIKITYEACPEDHSYSKGGDWLAKTGLDEAATYVIRRLR